MLLSAQVNLVYVLLAHSDLVVRTGAGVGLRLLLPRRGAGAGGFTRRMSSTVLRLKSEGSDFFDEGDDDDGDDDDDEDDDEEDEEDANEDKDGMAPRRSLARSSVVSSGRGPASSVASGASPVEPEVVRSLRYKVAARRVQWMVVGRCAGALALKDGGGKKEEARGSGGGSSAAAATAAAATTMGLVPVARLNLVAIPLASGRLEPPFVELTTAGGLPLFASCVAQYHPPPQNDVRVLP